MRVHRVTHARHTPKKANIQSGWYMASTSNIHPKYNDTMGIIQNTSNLIKGFYRSRFDAGVPFCIDNEVFADKFQVDSWKKVLELVIPYKETCLFIVIPDVIGNCRETLKQFSHYRNMVKDLPVALVSQDGIREQENDIPWDDFDCLFIGGSDEHKLGKEGGWILQEAKRHGKWVHVGRVNSPKRILKFWQADSWDGTHLGFMPSDVSKFHAAVLQVREMKKQKGLFDDIRSYVSRSDSIG